MAWVCCIIIIIIIKWIGADKLVDNRGWNHHHSNFQLYIQDFNMMQSNRSEKSCVLLHTGQARRNANGKHLQAPKKKTKHLIPSFIFIHRQRKHWQITRLTVQLQEDTAWLINMYCTKRRPELESHSNWSAHVTRTLTSIFSSHHRSLASCLHPYPCVQFLLLRCLLFPDSNIA